MSGGAEFVQRAGRQHIRHRPGLQRQVPVDRNVTGLFVEAGRRSATARSSPPGCALERIARQRAPGRRLVVRPPDRSRRRRRLVGESQSLRGLVRAARDAGSGVAAGRSSAAARAPASSRRRRSRSRFTNNPNLKPERSRSIDVGLEQALAGGALVADATFFANRYDDLIVAVAQSRSAASAAIAPTTSRTRRPADSSSASSGRLPRGAAGARDVDVALDTEVLAGDGLPTLRAVAVQGRRPARPAAAPARHARHHLDAHARQAFVTVDGRGEIADIEPNFGSPTFTNPGYASCSLGGSFTPRARARFLRRVTNLFDGRTRRLSGIPALGRSAMIGLRVAAGR